MPIDSYHMLCRLSRCWPCWAEPRIGTAPWPARASFRLGARSYGGTRSFMRIRFASGLAYDIADIIYISYIEYLQSNKKHCNTTIRSCPFLKMFNKNGQLQGGFLELSAASARINARAPLSHANPLFVSEFGTLRPKLASPSNTSLHTEAMASLHLALRALFRTSDPALWACSKGCNLSAAPLKSRKAPGHVPRHAVAAIGAVIVRCQRVTLHLS